MTLRVGLCVELYISQFLTSAHLPSLALGDSVQGSIRPRRPGYDLIGTSLNPYDFATTDVHTAYCIANETDLGYAHQSNETAT